MKEPIIHTVLCLVSSPDIYGGRRLICRIDKVEKPTFPRSGRMGDKGIYRDWNANVSPYCVWGLPGMTRYCWYKNLDDAIGSLNRRFQNEFYHGATFIDPAVYEREQEIAKQRYLANM